MSDQPKPQNLMDVLPPEQQARLKALQEQISFDKLTLSFSIEDRDGSGQKKSAFYSVTVSRGAGAELTGMGEGGTPAGFQQKDVPLVRALVSKHVVKSVYDDAIRRRVVGKGQAQEECRAILGAYDSLIVNLLKPGETK